MDYQAEGVLPRGYHPLPNATLVEPLRLLAPLDLEGDVFGKVYEYFLGNFARKVGQKGGVFYTPTSIVRLIGELANPDQNTLPKFEAVTRPMFQLIQSLELKNSTLRATRDLLLPRLISGELDVSSWPEPQAVAA